MGREQVDLLIEDTSESYQREIAELIARLDSKDKDVKNLRECLVLMNEMLDEKRGSGG